MCVTLAQLGGISAWCCCAVIAITHLWDCLTFPSQSNTDSPGLLTHPSTAYVSFTFLGTSKKCNVEYDPL